MTLSIFDAAAEAPRRPALIEGGRIRSYADLAESAAAALRWLDGLGVGEPGGEPVALVARNTAQAVEILHALIAAGVPVHLVHPGLTGPERQALLRRSGGSLLLDEAAQAEYAAAGRVARADQGIGASPASVAADERLLAVVYTSGSGGRPKGVRLSRRAFAAAAAASAANLGWREDDRWLLRLPVAHVGGLSILTRCLIARRCVVMADPDADRGPRALATMIERDEVTIVSLVPTLLRRLLDLEPRWDPPPALRAILLGGAASPRGLLERAADRGWPVLATYGMSESCSQVATQRPGTVDRGDGGVGPPLPGIDVRVVDAEIQVRGDVLFSGYHPPEDFPADPFLPGGWFPTGDLGRFDDAGRLHVLGRRDDVIITGGENVDPAEVEEALRGVGGVRDACVYGVADPAWGERVCAAVVVENRAEGTHDADSITAALRARLAAFKLPRDIVLVDALPLGPTGKVDRQEARRRHGPP